MARSIAVSIALAAAAAVPGASEAAGYLKGPYLQNTATDSVSILWEVDGPCDGIVDYGESDPPASSATDGRTDSFHEVRLTGLKPNTRYIYRAVSCGSVSASTEHWFVTAPPRGTPFRFSVYGDTRGATSLNSSLFHEKVADFMRTQIQPDLVLHVGDYIYTGEKENLWADWFNQARNLMLNTPMFGVIGNHEYKDGDKNDPANKGLGLWKKYFATPFSTGGSPDETYFSFDYSNAHFLGFSNYSALDPSSAQYKWIEADLAKAAADPGIDHIFVFDHETWFGVGFFDQNADNINHVLPLCEKYGVRAVFAGHDHSYAHAQKDGVHYVITGGGGAPLDTIALHAAWDYWKQYGLKYDTIHYHAMQIDIAGPRMVARMVTTDGTVVDEFCVDNVNGCGTEPPDGGFADGGETDSGTPDAGAPDGAPDGGAGPDTGDYCGTCGSQDEDPMCGKDGATYRNKCALFCAGAELDYPGPCAPDGGTCSGCAGLPDDPVCGADAVTYDNQCRLDCHGVAKAYDGACAADGGGQTDDPGAGFDASTEDTSAPADAGTPVRDGATPPLRPAAGATGEPEAAGCACSTLEIGR
ncbi:MAG: metallophosphoesterase [Deltaproteobacteria bacterium]|nr:metallophosphoesterase [Deltaproteobacteria bacterium]